MSEPACHILSKTGQIAAGANLRVAWLCFMLVHRQERNPVYQFPGIRGLHRLATSPIGNGEASPVT